MRCLLQNNAIDVDCVRASNIGGYKGRRVSRYELSRARGRNFENQSYPKPTETFCRSFVTDFYIQVVQPTTIFGRHVGHLYKSM
jgi:hypothetical protein